MTSLNGQIKRSLSGWKLLISLLLVLPVPAARFFDANEIVSVQKDIRYEFDILTLTGEFSSGKRYVRFKIGRKFYIADGMSHSLTHAPRLEKGRVMIPADLAEEIIAELRLPVKFRVSESLNTEPADSTSRTRPPVPEKPDIPADKPTSAEPAQKVSGLDYVVIDAGHGGHDPGAIRGKVREKDITLKLSISLAKHLRKTLPGTKIVLTRSRDTFISLEGRSEAANRQNPREEFGIFLSIHCNATLSPKISGMEIFYLSQNPSNEGSRQTMLRENGGARKYVLDLESKLLDARIQHESRLLARSLNASLNRSLQNTISNRGIRKADFAVLRGSLMPAVLIETGYITNPSDSEALRSDEFQEQFNLAVEKGIRDFTKRTLGKEMASPDDSDGENDP